MSIPIVAVITEATCGEACWTAKEPVCRCSCNGANHGTMLTAEGRRPQRMAKIDGVRYKLAAAGESYIGARAQSVNRAAGKHINQWGYEVPWSENDKGAPARIRLASVQQCMKWPELTAWKEAHTHRRPYLLWVREDIEIEQGKDPETVQEFLDRMLAKAEQQWWEKQVKMPFANLALYYKLGDVIVINEDLEEEAPEGYEICARLSSAWSRDQFKNQIRGLLRTLPILPPYLL